MSAAHPDNADHDEAYCASCNQSYPLDQETCPNDGAKLIKLQSGPDLLLGRVFDNRYEIRSALGSGGMGTVYRGWQRSVDREVAIKVIHPKLANDRVVAKRFLREARLSSRLSQANIVNVYDFGQSEDGILYLVMELLRGRTLTDDFTAPMPLRRVTTIARQICDALDAAHNCDIIHRDLKPGNIMLLDDPPGRDAIKILDFGVAKSLVSESSMMTRTDLLVGTPLYMSPEQIRGRPTDGRSDLYSLGCILYQMVSGRPPFLSENVNLTLAMHLRETAPPLPPFVPSSLAATIEKLMVKDPDTRIATAREVHDAIEQVADDHRGLPEEPNVARGRRKPAAPTSRNARPSSVEQVLIVPVASTTTRANRRWWLPALAISAVAGVAVLAVAALSGRSATTPDSGTMAGSGMAASRDAIVVAPAAADANSASLDAHVAELTDAYIVAVDARAPRATPAPAAARTPVDAGVHVVVVDAAPPVVPAASDAGIVLPNIDLLPTKRP